MRIAILGAGRLGKSLGTALRASRHHIVYGVREPAASRDLMTKSGDGAIAGAGTVILATPWTAAEALVCEHASALNDKIVIDRDSGRHSGAGMNENETQEMPGPESPRAMKIAP